MSPPSPPHGMWPLSAQPGKGRSFTTSAHSRCDAHLSEDKAEAQSEGLTQTPSLRGRITPVSGLPALHRVREFVREIFPSETGNVGAAGSGLAMFKVSARLEPPTKSSAAGVKLAPCRVQRLGRAALGELQHLPKSGVEVPLLTHVSVPTPGPGLYPG